MRERRIGVGTIRRAALVCALLLPSVAAAQFEFPTRPTIGKVQVGGSTKAGVNTLNFNTGISSTGPTAGVLTLNVAQGAAGIYADSPLGGTGTSASHLTCSLCALTTGATMSGVLRADAALGYLIAPTSAAHLLGGRAHLQAIGTPSAPTLAVTGGGTGTQVYKIVALDAFGNATATSATQTTGGTGPDTLDADHYVDITITAVTGASTYIVVRSSGGPSQGRITALAGQSALTLRDNGLAATAYTAPTRDATADILSGGGWVSEQADSAIAVALNVDTTTAWSNASARLLSLKTNASEKLYVDPLGFIVFGNSSTGLRSPSSSSNKIWVDDNSLKLQHSGNSVEIGGSRIVFGGPMQLPNFLEQIEISPGGPPAANNVWTYARDNGAGATALVAHFPGGSIRQLAMDRADTVVGDFSLSAGWGATRVVSSVVSGSNDERGRAVITAQGGTYGVNPTIVYTFKSAFIAAPFCRAWLEASTDTSILLSLPIATTAITTAMTATYGATDGTSTPVDTKTYTVAWDCRP